MLTRDLVDSPNFLAYKFDFISETVAFLPIERDQIRRVSALKREYIAGKPRLVEVPLAELTSLATSPSATLSEKPPRFLFHTAFCASTFLSRCLDVEGVTVCLREPQILLDAANAKRLQWRSRSTTLDYHHLPGLALSLLEKHAGKDETLIIKPINSVNNIIPELLQLTGSSKSLMLYTDAMRFILSTLRKGEGGKQTVRSMFDLIRCDFAHLSNLQLTHAIHMTDLRVMMTLWRLQIEQANAAIREFSGTGNVASLYGENVINSLPKVLHAANRFLELGISAEQIEAVLKSKTRFMDAKNDNETFDRQKRDLQHEQMQNFFATDIEDGLEWLVRNNPGTSLIPELRNALAI